MLGHGGCMEIEQGVHPGFTEPEMGLKHVAVFKIQDSQII